MKETDSGHDRAFLMLALPAFALADTGGTVNATVAEILLENAVNIAAAFYCADRRVRRLADRETRQGDAAEYREPRAAGTDQASADHGRRAEADGCRRHEDRAHGRQADK